MKKIYVIVIALALNLSNAFAQDKNYVTGEILVQLQEEQSATALLNNFTSREFSLSVPERVSKSLNIWKFNYSPANADIEKVLNFVFETTGVVAVQKNHILENRATPNDSKYSSQWQYEQRNDIDLDAPEAWEITTGGKTANGDEIVVAVIDDGCNLNHEDLVDNLWTNKHEIPNNNKDDDGNGFVDDVRGWNSGNKNDRITGGGHGTPVAGIVGAKGNNNKGVAGVNWNVKLMIIQGGGQEKAAIAAYDYALQNRKLYNETNGEKGAFVVATNASWGIDGGKAKDAPLWCAFYDELGEAGILNAAATTNRNYNVEVKGDLPTQCTSDYLIAVTNVQKNDEKRPSAGYGKTSIDLGAFGTDTYTVTRTSYGGFGGTSAATPHVAGTIALLYSVPSKGFADLAKKDPAKAALKAKAYIMDNADPNKSLQGITVTGGRLNMHKSLKGLLSDSTLSIDEVNSAYDATTTIYPNPTSNTLNFKTTSNSVITKVIVYATDGKLVKTVDNTTVNKINVSDIENGTYIIRYKKSDSNLLYHKLFRKK